jgi:hypothetical protein
MKTVPWQIRAALWSIAALVLLSIAFYQYREAVFFYFSKKSDLLSNPTTSYEQYLDEQYQDPSWWKVGVWAHSGSVKTNEFEITKPEWRVRWSLSELSGQKGGFFSFVVCRENGQVAHIPKSDSGNLFEIHGTPGRYHLRVTSNLSYTITVEEKR